MTTQPTFNQPTSAGPTGTGTLDRMFAALHRSPVTRGSDRVIGGVCSGIAHHFGIAPAIVRVAAVVLAMTGLGLPAYLVLVLLLPSRDGRIRLERAIRGGETSSVLLLIAGILLILPGSFNEWRFTSWTMLGAVAVAATLTYWLTRSRSTAGAVHPSTEQPATRPANETPNQEGPQDAR